MGNHLLLYYQIRICKTNEPIHSVPTRVVCTQQSLYDTLPTSAVMVHPALVHPALVHGVEEGWVWRCKEQWREGSGGGGIYEPTGGLLADVSNVVVICTVKCSLHCIGEEGYR